MLPAILARLSACLRALKGCAGKIAYYTGVAIVLTAVAYAAECYRKEEAVQTDAFILPAVEEVKKTNETPPLFQRNEAWNLIRAFNSQTEWNDELLQWQAHAAADYSCRNDIVESISDGKVLFIGRNGQYGNYIEIETEEYLLRYASVLPVEELTEGAKVKAGERIGVADDTMPGETQAGSHVHLEILKSGAYLDPETELGKIHGDID